MELKEQTYELKKLLAEQHSGPEGPVACEVAEEVVNLRRKKEDNSIEIANLRSKIAKAR